MRVVNIFLKIVYGKWCIFIYYLILDLNWLDCIVLKEFKKLFLKFDLINNYKRDWSLIVNYVCIINFVF